MITNKEELLNSAEQNFLVTCEGFVGKDCVSGHEALRKTDKDEVIIAANIIKTYCITNKGCFDCVFSKPLGCEIHSKPPCWWNIAGAADNKSVDNTEAENE